MTMYVARSQGVKSSIAGGHPPSSAPKKVASTAAVPLEQQKMLEFDALTKVSYQMKGFLRPGELSEGLNKAIPSGYEIINTSDWFFGMGSLYAPRDHVSGFRAVTLHNKKDNTIAVSFMGTDPTDLYYLTDDCKLAFEQVPNMCKPAREYMEQAYLEAARRGVPTENVWAVGHSFGKLLAEVVQYPHGGNSFGSDGPGSEAIISEIYGSYDPRLARNMHNVQASYISCVGKQPEGSFQYIVTSLGEDFKPWDNARNEEIYQRMSSSTWNNLDSSFVDSEEWMLTFGEMYHLLFCHKNDNIYRGLEKGRVSIIHTGVGEADEVVSSSSTTSSSSSSSSTSSSSRKRKVRDHESTDVSVDTEKSARRRTVGPEEVDFSILIKRLGLDFPLFSHKDVFLDVLKELDGSRSDPSLISLTNAWFSKLQTASSLPPRPLPVPSTGAQLYSLLTKGIQVDALGGAAIGVTKPIFSVGSGASFAKDIGRSWDTAHQGAVFGYTKSEIEGFIEKAQGDIKKILLDVKNRGVVFLSSAPENPRRGLTYKLHEQHITDPVTGKQETLFILYGTSGKHHWQESVILAATPGLAPFMPVNKSWNEINAKRRFGEWWEREAQAPFFNGRRHEQNLSLISKIEKAIPQEDWKTAEESIALLPQEYQDNPWIKDVKTSVFYNTNRGKEALALLDGAIESGRRRNIPCLLASLTLHAQTGNTTEAKKRFDECIDTAVKEGAKTEVKELAAYVFGSALDKQNQPKEALEVLKSFPSLPSLALAREIARKEGDKPQEDALTIQLAEMGSSNLEVLFTSAEICFLQKEWGKANQYGERYLAESDKVSLDKLSTPEQQKVFTDSCRKVHAMCATSSLALDDVEGAGSHLVFLNTLPTSSLSNPQRRGSSRRGHSENDGVTPARRKIASAEIQKQKAEAFLLMKAFLLQRAEKLVQEGEKAKTIEERKQKRDLAIVDLKQILAENSQDFSANFHLGAIYLENNSLDEAYFHLSEAEKTNPNDPAVLYDLGILHSKKNDKDLAISYFGRSEKAAHENLQEEQARLGLKEDELVAQERLLEVLATFEKQAHFAWKSCLIEKADDCLHNKDIHGAQQILKLIVEKDPKDFDANCRIAGIELSSGNLKNAKQYIDLAKEVNPNAVEVLLLQADHAYARGLPAEGDEWLVKLEALAPPPPPQTLGATLYSDLKGVDSFISRGSHKLTRGAQQALVNATERIDAKIQQKAIAGKMNTVAARALQGALKGVNQELTDLPVNLAYSFGGEIGSLGSREITKVCLGEEYAQSIYGPSRTVSEIAKSTLGSVAKGGTKRIVYRAAESAVKEALPGLAPFVPSLNKITTAYSVYRAVCYAPTWADTAEETTDIFLSLMLSMGCNSAITACGLPVLGSFAGGMISGAVDPLIRSGVHWVRMQIAPPPPAEVIVPPQPSPPAEEEIAVSADEVAGAVYLTYLTHRLIQNDDVDQRFQPSFISPIKKGLI